jgi:dihydrodipicolinate reductase
MKVLVVDGQSGRMGQLFIEKARAAGLPCEITAVGTNSLATAAMLKAGAGAGPRAKTP